MKGVTSIRLWRITPECMHTCAAPALSSNEAYGRLFSGVGSVHGSDSVDSAACAELGSGLGSGSGLGLGLGVVVGPGGALAPARLGVLEEDELVPGEG